MNIRHIPLILSGMAVLSFAACTTATPTGAARAFEDPAVQKLYNLSTPQYYATLRIANQVALNCARYSYDTVLDVDINERRNAVGRGSLSALALRDAIDIESDISQRSFDAKHGVDLATGGGDLCPAADTETLENSALAAVLVRG